MSYKILWVDDEYDTPQLQAIADAAYDKGIDMDTACKSAEEALAHLQHPNFFDAIILDARFYKTKSNVSGQEDLKGLKAIDERLLNLKNNGTYIPAFIFSGQTDVHNDSMFSETYNAYPLYDKHSDSDRDRLFNDIIEAAKNRSETRIKHKYSEIFDACINKYGFKPEVTDILFEYAVAIEENKTNDSSLLNSTRKVIEKLFDVFVEKGLLPKGITDMNKKRNFLCFWGMKTLIPQYVRDSIYYVVDVTQEGSHGSKDTKLDSDVRNGLAPYALRSFFFSFGNIVVWWKRFFDEVHDWNEIKSDIDRIYKDWERQNASKKTDGMLKEKKSDEVKQKSNINYCKEKGEKDSFFKKMIKLIFGKSCPIKGKY